MSKLLVMLFLTALGVGGSLAISPFYGVAIYYLYAVLRPAYLWKTSLPDLPWSVVVAAAAIFSTAVWRIGAALAPRRHPDFRPPAFNIGHVAVLLFAGWVTVAYHTAFSQTTAEPYYDEYSKIFIMFLVAALCITTIRQIWILYVIVALSLSYIAFEVNTIYLQGGYTYFQRNGYAGLDNNGAALMLAMGVPLCLFAWDGIRHWIRWGFLACIPLFLHAVMFSYSRGAMLALIISIPIYIIRCRRKGQLLAILVGVALMVPILAGQQIQDRFFSIDKRDEDGSAQSRLTTWGIAWQMAQERPVFGFGIRNSNLFTYAYGADMEGRTIHSNYLQIAADCGLVGLAAYLFVIGSFLICLRRVRHRLQGHCGVVHAILGTGAFLFLRRWHQPENKGRDDPEMIRAYTIASGVEGALLVFCFGSIFLSLETFELPYILFLMAAQLWAVLKLSDVESPGTAVPGRERENQAEQQKVGPVSTEEILV